MTLCCYSNDQQHKVTHGVFEIFTHHMTVQFRVSCAWGKTRFTFYRCMCENCARTNASQDAVEYTCLDCFPQCVLPTEPFNKLYQADYGHLQLRGIG